MSSVADVDRAAAVRSIAERVQTADRGPLLPILHEVTDRFGYVDHEDVTVIAETLNLSIAEVHGVVSFYHDFPTTPPVAHQVRICRGEACQAVGGQSLFAGPAAVALRERGDAAVEQVFCLGNCALGPSGTVDGVLHGRLSDERLTSLTAEWSR